MFKYKVKMHVGLGLLPFLSLAFLLAVTENQVTASRKEVNHLIKEISAAIKSGILDDLRQLKKGPNMSKDQVIEKLKEIGLKEASKQNGKIKKLAKLTPDSNIVKNVTIELMKSGEILKTYQDLIQDELETRSMGPFTLVTTETMKAAFKKALADVKNTTSTF